MANVPTELGGGKPFSETDDEIRARIRARKKARKQSPKSNSYNRKILRLFLGSMELGKIYMLEDIEVIIEKTGNSSTGSGPATTYGVRDGYLERVGRSQYRATGKPLED
jgi:hypothetical protein